MAESKYTLLAICTYEKAQILKTILEGEGVMVLIENANKIQPIVADGVRINILEEDFEKAREIIEDLRLSELLMPAKEKKPLKKRTNTILVPVDFSSHSWNAAVWAVNFASRIGADVFLLHVLYVPFYMGGAFSLEAGGGAVPYGLTAERISALQKEAKNRMTTFLEKLIRSAVDAGELPKTEIKARVLRGLPEEIIVDVANSMNPQLIVMGMHNIKQDGNSEDSIVDEVLDQSPVPVLVIPEGYSVSRLADVSRIGFATSFSDKDISYFQEFVSLSQRYTPQIYLFNISTSKNEWDTIRLNGLQTYLSDLHPESHITHRVLPPGDRIEAIRAFIQEEGIQLLVLPLSKRSVWLRLFSPSLAQQLLRDVSLPILLLS